MKPVMQNRFGLDGNCMSAALASLFELPLDGVPEVLPCEPGSERWREAMDEWLAERNLGIYECGAFDEDGTMASFPGFQMLMCTVLNHPVLEGGVPLRHAVVASEGQIVHDPFPGGKRENLWPHSYAMFFVRDPAKQVNG